MRWLAICRKCKRSFFKWSNPIPAAEAFTPSAVMRVFAERAAVGSAGNGERVMSTYPRQIEYALAHPVFDPMTQIVTGHFWHIPGGWSAGLTLNIGME